MAADPIRVNGSVFSWGSAEIRAGDDVLIGITAVNYSATRERSWAYGASPQRGPIARTTGKYAAEGSLTLLTHTAAALRERLDDGDGSYGDTPFDVVVSFAEDGLDTHTVELRDCVIVGESSNPSEGTDPNTDELQLSIREIVYDGRTLAEVG